MPSVAPAVDQLIGETLDDKILNLWKGKPENFGAFSGLRTFKNSLNEYGVDKNIHYIQKLFQNKNPSYSMSVRLPRTFPRRKYIATSGYGESVQTDLAFMNDFAGRIGFIVVVDVFSRKIFASPISNKTSAHIEDKLEHIFNNELKKYPSSCASDNGGEYQGLKGYFHDHNIQFHIKQGKIKAGFAGL